jgi:glycosyltransferase involved in cell wall biosynthesis
VGAHIAMLLPDLRIGGAQRVILTLARAFSEKGVSVDLVVGLEDGDLRHEIPDGVRLVPLCSTMPVFGAAGLGMLMLLRLHRYLRRNAPDALLSTLSRTNLVAVAARMLARSSARLVLREASHLENVGNPVVLQLMRRLYRHSDAVVALTTEMHLELERVLRLPPEKVKVIPNPVDLERIRVQAAQPLPASFSMQRPFMLTVGRFAQPKDFVTLLRAFARIVSKQHVDLVIVGEGPDRPVIEAEIRALLLRDHVKLVGFDSNPYRWMSQACLFVLSSRWEGCPNVVLEARALGLPVLSTDYGASARLMVQGAGEVVPINDEIAMARAMRFLLKKHIFLDSVDRVDGSVIQAGSSSADYAVAIDDYAELLIPECWPVKG